MKLTVFTVMLPDLTPEEAMRALGDTGYDGVEWRVAWVPEEKRGDASSFWGDNRCIVAPTQRAYDRPAAGGVWQPCWAPLEDGVVDFLRLFGALEAVGYDGWLVVEDFSEARESRAALKHDYAFVQHFLREQVIA